MLSDFGDEAGVSNTKKYDGSFKIIRDRRDRRDRRLPRQLPAGFGWPLGSAASLPYVAAKLANILRARAKLLPWLPPPLPTSPLSPFSRAVVLSLTTYILLLAR
jgi:hypothetical protein